MTTWNNDAVQFPRLLAELRAVGLTNDQYRDLTTAMDLTFNEIDELLERAETAWQAIKAQTTKSGYVGAVGRSEAALRVLVTTPHVVDYLTRHDPKALVQARTALDPNGPQVCPDCQQRHWSFYGCYLGTCPECGQGPAMTYAYEHKSTCVWWRSNED